MYKMGLPDLYIYAFHMPFFFLISGMLHKYNGYVQWGKYTKALILPFLWFNVFTWLFLAPLFYYGIVHLKGLSIEGNFYTAFWEVFYYYLSKFKPFNGPTWFLIALFYCKVLLDLSIPKKLFIPLFAVFICFVLYTSLSGDRLRALFIGNGMMALPFYFCGYYYKNEILKWINSYKMKGMIFLLLLSYIVLTSLNGRVSMNGVEFGVLPFPMNVVVFYINGLITSFGVLYLASLIKYKASWVTAFANSLITILCAQYFFVYTFKCTIGRNHPFYITIPLTLVIFLCCYAIHRFLIRYMPFVLGKTK